MSSKYKNIKKIDMILNSILFICVFLSLFQNFFTDNLFEKSSVPNKSTIESMIKEVNNKIAILKNETKKLEKVISNFEQEIAEPQRRVMTKKLKRQAEQVRIHRSDLKRLNSELKKQNSEYINLKNKRKHYFSCIIASLIALTLLIKIVYKKFQRHP